MNTNALLSHQKAMLTDAGEISKVAQTFTENTVAVLQRWSDNRAPGINFSESAFTFTDVIESNNILY